MRASLAIPLVFLVALGALAAGCSSLPESLPLVGDERPYELSFSGNERITRRELQRAASFDLAHYESSGFERAHIDDAAFELELHYKKLGFPEARVEYEVDQGGQRPRVRFKIHEGPRATIASIQIEGNDSPGFDDESLITFFEGPRSGLLGRGDLYYVADRARSAAQQIERTYVDSGWLEARVERPTVVFNEARDRVDVRFAVEEGRPYTLGQVSLDWGDRPRALEQELLTLVQRRQGGGRTRFAPRLPFVLRGELLGVLAGAAYPDASIGVQTERNDEAAKVDITYTIQLGPEVTLSEVSFEGEISTNAAFLRSRVLVGEGDAYDSGRLRDSVARLYATGLFRRVGTELIRADDEPDDAPSATRALVFRLVETPSIELFVEPGYGSYEQLRLTLGGRERNLFGSGRSLRAESTLAILAQRVEIDLTDPWFLGSSLISDFTVSADRRELPSFTSVERGVGFFLTKEWTRHLTTSVGYQYRRSKAQDVKVVDQEVRSALDSLDISAVRATQRVDYRNNFFVPTAGSYAELTLEVGDKAIASDLGFLRGLTTLATYRSLGPKSVVAAAFRLGAIAPTGNDTSIPLQERFFNGGENAVRSYREGELGPRDVNGNPIGGEAFSTISLELRRDLVGRLQGALFADVGNVSPEWQNALDFNSLESGLGIGLRYVLPVGPIRLDLAANPSPEAHEDELVLHLSVGMAF